MAERKGRWISDEQMADIKRRTAKGKTRSPFDPAEVRRRKQDEQQAKKRQWS